jgi:hypothetical protein
MQFRIYATLVPWFLTLVQFEKRNSLIHTRFQPGVVEFVRSPLTVSPVLIAKSLRKPLKRLRWMRDRLNHRAEAAV